MCIRFYTALKGQVIQITVEFSDGFGFMSTGL